MYIPGVYASIIIFILLFPFLIPTKLKSKSLRYIKTSLIVLLTISILSSIAPETAQIGAPFHKYGKPKIAYFGCNYQIQLTKKKFCDSSKSLDWCFCNNFNAFATLAHCYEIGHPNEIDSLFEMCSVYNKTLNYNTLTHANDYYTNHAKSIMDLPNESDQDLIHFPIKLNETEIHIFEKAYTSFLGNFDISVDYGAYLVLYWVAIFVVAGLSNWLKYLCPQIFKYFTDPLTNWFRSRISLPSTNNKNKTNELKIGKIFDMLVPTRAESLILVGFTILCTYFMTAQISYTEGDPLFHTKTTALLRYYAVRASLLSSTMMPLLILFGGRNNFLQWVTRWDYSTFITLHRWVSRVIMILITIHSFNYSIYLRINHKGIEPYIVLGSAAFISGVIIMIQGLLVLRRKWYEMFLVLHIILAAIFIFGAWLHVETLYCVWFYYVSATIWAFDRIIRILRLVQYGFPTARIYLLPDETLKVIVPRPKDWEAIPGGHAFIHFLKWDCFWQSHPFTYTTTNHHIILFIKVKKGVTRTLADYLKTHKNICTLRVAIEGSYGEKTPAGKYDSAVFIAGGNGIPGIFSEAIELTDNHQNQIVDNQNKIKLIWVVREYSSLLWFYEELISLRNFQIETTIYVTRPHLPITEGDFERRILSTDTLKEHNELSPLLTSSSQKQSNSSTSLIDIDKSSSNSYHSTNLIFIIQKELKHINFIESRPNMSKIVESNIEESRGSTCFVTCGHPAMVDEVRQSVVVNIYNTERKRVDYYEQLQVWA
ncbi:hypothetical protein KGF54_004543 [Candida jiufengensis]|uniref:uncharacterized protein n=1 Tax=Candida jiufengensis TaxID=497108 RepID=UPI0022254EB1|nr:uncharacterized protein KGF54_004543 [Candida jiufengensis]KAI5951469.1 hypothetical protein KGF54_004543 [Candida jiufengensis]